MSKDRKGQEKKNPPSLPFTLFIGHDSKTDP